jgi:hypothetical protein
MNTMPTSFKEKPVIIGTNVTVKDNQKAPLIYVNAVGLCTSTFMEKDTTKINAWVILPALYEDSTCLCRSEFKKMVVGYDAISHTTYHMYHDDRCMVYNIPIDMADKIRSIFANWLDDDFYHARHDVHLSSYTEEIGKIIDIIDIHNQVGNRAFVTIPDYLMTSSMDYIERKMQSKRILVLNKALLTLDKYIKIGEVDL